MHPISVIGLGLVGIALAAFGLMVWSLCRGAAHADAHLSTLDHFRKWERDASIGRDQVTPAEREKWRRA
jgi:hypothetical protein